MLTYEQLVFEFVPQSEYDPSKFVISECNKQAYDYLQNWTPGEQWGCLPYPNSLILKGPKDAGKSFLSHIWAYRNKALIARGNLAQFDYELVDKHDFFVLDNLDFTNEIAIFHAFNIINENKKHLLITLDAGQEIILPDLKSRLVSLNALKIYPPDDQLISLLLEKLFASYGVTVKQEVINYLLNHLTRDFHSITQFAKEINLYSLQQKKNITIPLIKKYFAHT
jgi:chromosomal replication initiation ATPase DnaA